MLTQAQVTNYLDMLGGSISPAKQKQAAELASMCLDLYIAHHHALHIISFSIIIKPNLPRAESSLISYTYMYVLSIYISLK
jgi:hypothetical protein